MSLDVDPPINDQVIERHQFYATLSSHVNRNAKDISGIGYKIKDYSTNFDVVRDEVRASGTRNKTIISAAIVVWTFIGGGLGLYITRGLSTFDGIIAKVENIERKIIIIESVNEQRKEMPATLEALKRSVNELQREK